jgi:hypothetical protein
MLRNGWDDRMDEGDEEETGDEEDVGRVKRYKK